MIRLASAIVAVVALAGAGGAHAATLQQVGVFDDPMHVAADPSDPNRLFVVEREGTIVEVRGGATSVFAELGSVVSCCAQERGLQSIALAPDFATSGRLYAFYTGEANEIRVGELRAAGDEAPLSSLRDVLEIPHPGQTNHYGGQLQFGPEGLLYISTGDGGGGDDPAGNAQNLDSLLGKILRIDPLPSGLLRYTVPAGNPFLGGPSSADDPIWSLGLRNPYRFSFDQASGAMLIGDVGQEEREEVDYAAPGAGAGANYGWDCREGTLPGVGPSPACAPPPPGGFTEPIFEYPHSDPSAFTGCAIVGGYVVRDRGLEDLFGRYLYGDYCAGELRSFDLADPTGSDRSEDVEVGELTSFGQDSCGRLYVASQAGPVSRLVDGSDPCPETTPQTTPRAPSFLGIRAQSRRVPKRKRAQITVFVSPCTGRRGEPVKLIRGRTHLATRRLDRACSARFRPRITRRVDFRATIAADDRYVAATSRKLRIKIRHVKAAKRR